MTEQNFPRYIVGGAFQHAIDAPLEIDWSADGPSIAAYMVADYMGLAAGLDADLDPQTDDEELIERFAYLQDRAREVINVMILAGHWRTIRHCLATGQNAEATWPTIERAIYRVYVGD